MKGKRKSWSCETSLERAGKRQTIYNIIHELHTLRVDNLIDKAEEEEIDRIELKDIVGELRQKGLVYTPKPGYIGCVED